MRQLFIFLLLLLWLSGCAQEEVKIIQEGAVSFPEEMPRAEEGLAEPEISLQELEIKTNPFLTAQEEESFRQTEGQQIIEDFHLAAIFYSPFRRWAIIDGRILSEGESIDSKKIVKILRESVVLKDEEGEYMLKLGRISP